MPTQSMDYPQLIKQALRGVVRRILERVAEEGLPGEHHFVVTLRTDHPGTQLPEALRSRYPEEMTIVLQHQFWDLVVEEGGFGLTLAFDGVRHRLWVPFEALDSFVDPAAQIGLRFSEEAGKTTPGEPSEADETELEETTEDRGADVLSFRHRRERDES